MHKEKVYYIKDMMRSGLTGRWKMIQVFKADSLEEVDRIKKGLEEKMIEEKIIVEEFDEVVYENDKTKTN